MNTRNSLDSKECTSIEEISGMMAFARGILGFSQHILAGIYWPSQSAKLTGRGGVGGVGRGDVLYKFLKLFGKLLQKNTKPTEQLCTMLALQYVQT